MKSSNRIIVNTGILYGNMVITASIALISTRWILEALGQTDYGIYSLVGGIIAMFSFLNVAMVAATQRFISYSLGQKKEDVIAETFRCSVLLHIIIGLVVICLFELLGNYFLYNRLQIPEERLDEAITVLHCLSISTFFTITTVPYQAILNARENMLIIALISIYESSIKLCIALILINYYGDRLILYSVMMMLLTISSMIISRIYCHKHYSEVKIDFTKKVDYTLFKKMFSFAGWNFIGSTSSLLRNQGLAMLMNSFFGVIINAAYGIATQVNGQAQFFSRTIVRAVQPQIVKSEGAGQRERMIKMTMTSCKIPFLMLSIIVAPLIAEMPFILSFWLKSVPESSVSFCIMILLTTLLMQTKVGLSIAIDSVGKIKWYQIVCGGMHFIVIPISYILYFNGLGAIYGLYIIFCEEIVTIIFTSLFAENIVGIPITRYYRIILPSIIIVTSLSFMTYFITRPINNDWLRLLSYGVLYITTLSFIGYNILLSSEERNIIRSFTSSLVKKFRNI